jgi:DNA polymerase I-like protein with 3'-5' exonuclease and polymerase domains
MLQADSNVISRISDVALHSDVIFLDTETTGLEWHKGCMPFSIIVSDMQCEPIYLNLIDYGDGSPIATPEEIKYLKELINSCKILVMHNAKFDLHMSQNIGIVCSKKFAPIVWCTMTMHRYVNNACMSYSLAALTGAKSDAVKEWISKNPQVGKFRDANGKLQKAYWRVPYNIIAPYGKQDVHAMRKLYIWQNDEIERMIAHDLVERQSLTAALLAECESVRMLWDVERTGMLIDPDYTQAGYDYELACAAKAHAAFEKLTGTRFVSSGKALEKVFAAYNIVLPKTAKGNTKSTDDVLDGIDHPVCDLIRTIRKHEKRANTYFKNYLDMRSNEGRIHTNFNSCGADTLRMSSSQPNLQNVSANSEENSHIDIRYPLRGCFVPTSGYELCSIDFAAQEMRCVIDCAGEVEIANQILGGLDVHQATANLMGVNRYTGKTLGFSILYGSGVGRLAASLKVPVEEARRLRDLYFGRLVNVRNLTKALSNTALEFGHITTVYGNVLYVETDSAYKAVNYFVQGSCAIHTKKAAVSVWSWLLAKGYRTRIVAIIHDEIVLEVWKEEKAAVLPVIRKLMVDAFPHKILPMDTSCETYSERWDKDGVEVM